MTSRSVYLAALFGVALFPSAPIVLAQAGDCTYDRCALRIQSRVFSERVVAGAHATPVATLGPFGARIEVLATANDSSRVHYQAYRTYQSRAGALSLVATIALVAYVGVAFTEITTLSEQRRRDNLQLGILAAGFGFSFVSVTQAMTGRDRLHRAIWFYNRSLPAAP